MNDDFKVIDKRGTDETSREFEEADKRYKTGKLKALAPRIPNNQFLREYLFRLPVALRRETYDTLAPMVKFKPMKFERLMLLN
jgi:hypothetical protein